MRVRTLQERHISFKCKGVSQHWRLAKCVMVPAYPAYVLVPLDLI